MRVDTAYYGNYRTAKASAPLTGIPVDDGEETTQSADIHEADGRDKVNDQAVWSNVSPDDDDEKKLNTTAAANSSGGLNAEGSSPKDSSSALTARLVAATGQFEVRQIMADANKNLIELRMIAATGSPKDQELAKAYIKKLEKLVSRAGKKIKGLDNEDMLKLQQSRAEQKRQEQRAEEIKAELRRERLARKMKENGYLLEELNNNMLGGSSDGSVPLDAATEAQISAQAEAIASAEAAATGTGGGVDAGMAFASGSVSVAADSGGGEAAVSAEGGGGGEGAAAS